MTDEVLRRLERARDRSPADEVAYLAAAFRAVASPRDRLEFAARVGDGAAAKVLGIQPQPRPGLTEEALLPVIGGERVEPYAIVPLTLARALRTHWDKFTKSDRVGVLIAAAEAWLAHPCDAHRLEASRAGRPLSASQWQDELAQVRSKGKRDLLKWNKKAHDQVPPAPSFAERFAAQAAQIAGATAPNRAEAIIHETLRAFDHNTQVGIAFMNYVPVEPEELADSVASNIAAWALGRTAEHAAMMRPLRPPPPTPTPKSRPQPAKRPKYLQDILDRKSKSKPRKKVAKQR